MRTASHSVWPFVLPKNLNLEAVHVTYGPVKALLSSNYASHSKQISREALGTRETQLVGTHLL